MSDTDSQSSVSCDRLVTELHRLAKQAQQCIRYRAVFVWLTVVLAVLAILMLVDCLFQREEVGLRWLAFLALLAATGYAAFRWLRPIQRLAISPSDVARWIEAHQPEWAGRILTTFELSQLPQNDKRFGSETFRSAALHSWQQTASQPEWEQLLDKSSLKLAVWSAVAMILLLLLSLVIWPEMGIRSLTRVLAPWADSPWPRRDQLQFLNLPAVVARETAVQLEIADANPPMPENVVVFLRQAESEESPQSIPAQMIGDIAVANLPTMAGDIQVRAIGGDDRQMPWQTIRVIATPNWKQFHFEIKPPDYLIKTAAALERLTKQLDPDRGSYLLSGQRIQVVEGSSVRFEGRLDSAVNNISVRMFNTASSSLANGRDSDTGRSNLDSPWSVELVGQDRVVLRGGSDQPMTTIDRPLVWKFQIQSPEGVQLDCPEKWQIEVIPDNPPEVALSPMPLKSLALGANLHFEGTVRDDWGLSQLLAKVMLNEQAESVIELPLDIEPAFSRQTSIQSSWNFSSQLANKGYQQRISDQITFWIEATDVRGQTVRSSIERLNIEAKQKQLDAIATRQSSVARQIGELLSMQRSAQQLARRNADSIKQSVDQSQQQIDSATSVAQLQQTIHQQLSESSQGVLSSIQSQLNLAEQNNLGDSALAGELHALKARISELASGSALDALRQADQLLRALENSLTSKQPADWSELNSELDRSQTRNNQALSELLEGLDRSDLANRQREKLLQIADQQAEIARRTDQLGMRDGKKQQEVKAEIEQLAAMQNELARSLEQWLASILQPDQAEAVQLAGLRDIAGSLVDKNTASQMRSSGSSLLAQQLGEALQTQKQIQRTLQDVIEKMNPEESSELLNDLAQQAERLRQAATAAQQLASAQQQLAQRMADPRSKTQAQQLADQQQKLLESTKQLSAQLSGDQSAGKSMQEVMDNQSRAAQAAQANRLDQSVSPANEAAKQLKSIAERAEQQADGANQQVQQQQMFELISSVEQIVLRQKELMPQYEQLVRQLRLPALPADHGQLQHALIKRQTNIRDQLRPLIPSATQLPVFQWVLKQADDELTRAIAAAERNRLIPDAVHAAESGLKKLEIAIRTVAENGLSNTNESKNNDSNQATGKQEQAQQEQSLPPLVSLKLIRALQLELKQQTEQLESTSAEDQSLRAAELMVQQRELAELLERFLTDLQPRP